VAGRLPNVKRADEIDLNRVAAKRYRLHVGDRMSMRSSTHIEAFYGQAPFDGPRQQVTIVGVGDSMIDLLFGPGEPGFVPSFGFLHAHPEVPRAPNLVVRLAPGTNLERFRSRAAAALGI